MSGKDRKVYRSLNYFEHFLVFVSSVSSCASTSVFPSVADVSIGVTSSPIGWKTGTITARIKTLESSRKRKMISMLPVNNQISWYVTVDMILSSLLQTAKTYHQNCLFNTFFPK